MPRDVLTLDVEINPTQIMQQTNMAREMIAQGLASGGSMPGTMSPFAPAFAPESFSGTAFQAAFSPGFAPPYIPADQYQRGLEQSLENRFALGAEQAATSTMQFGAELTGGVAGGALFGAVGERYFGAPGKYIGTAAGAALGASVFGEFAGLMKEGIDQGAKGILGVEEVFKQQGYQAGMGSFLQGKNPDIDGSMSGQEVMQQLAQQSIETVTNANPELRAMFKNPNFQELTQQILAGGFRENAFGMMPQQFGGENDQELLQEFQERLKPYAKSITALGKGFQTTSGEALEISADLARLGAYNPEDKDRIAALYNEGFYAYGQAPKELLAATAPQGSAIARQAGLSGDFGIESIAANAFRLEDSRKRDQLDRETIQAGGGIPNLAAAFTGLESSQLNKGGYLRDLIMASTTEEGGLDSNKLKDLISKGATPLEARELANRALFSGGDPLKKQEEFNYNFRDLADQARKEIPGFEQAGIEKEVMAAAKQMAASSGRDVTQATIFQAAQRFGLNESQARAFAESGGASPESNIGEMMMRGQKRFDEDAGLREESVSGNLATRFNQTKMELQKFGAGLGFGGQQLAQTGVTAIHEFAREFKEFVTFIKGVVGPKTSVDTKGNSPTSAPSSETGNPPTGAK